MTIRLRLTLWYTGLLCATLILFSVVVYSALATNLWAQIQQDADRQAVIMAAAVSGQIRRELALGSQIQNIQLPTRDFFARIVGIRLLGTDGKVYKHSSNLDSVFIKDNAQALDNIRSGLSHRYYTTIGAVPVLVYSVPLKVGSQVVGAIQVVRSVADVASALSQASRYLIFGTALCLVLAAIVGAFLARRALAPIDMITETASNISRTEDLSRRLAISDQVSEVGRLAATFNEMLDRIQQLFLTQERLVADVSHELRTPLTTVQGNIQLLRRMSEVPGDSPQAKLVPELMKDSLNEVEIEATRMSNMINDLLLLAQADSGALQVQQQPVEMDTLLLEVYVQTRRIAEQRKGPGALDIRLGHEDQASVLGDRERLRQLLLNLTDNAIKYTPSGGTITLGLQSESDWVKVWVSDTGIGMSEENQRQIFERFYRTDKARSRAQGGSGLGLSIVQWIAEAHHGRVEVTSTPQVGSTFTLWLPALPAEANHAANSTRRNDQDSPPHSLDDVELQSPHDAA